MKKKKKSFKSIIITTITILIITNIITSLDHFLDFKKHRPEGKWFWYGYARCPEFNGGYKICASNIRVLEGAVEMYCYDHEDNMMTVLDIDKLVEEGYLKSIPTTHKNCKYISKGVLTTEEGKICCELHGNLSDIAQNYEKEKKKFDEKNTIYNVSIRLLPALLYFIYAITFLAI